MDGAAAYQNVCSITPTNFAKRFLNFLAFGRFDLQYALVDASGIKDKALLRRIRILERAFKIRAWISMHLGLRRRSVRIPYGGNYPVMTLAVIPGRHRV